MDKEAQVQLTERINDYLDSGTDPMADSVMVHPTDRYVNTDHLERERSALFDEMPIVVGVSDLVRSPGDFFTDDLSGRPLLIVRGQDGILRGFHNSCGHRGAQVESAASGCSRRFTCPYHAWSYDTVGALRTVPNDDGFADLDLTTRGLIQLPVEERHGLVWARPTAPAGASVGVAAFLGDLDDELSMFQMHDYLHDRTDVLHESFNWKQVVDGFLETYHLRFLHRNTIGPFINSNFAMFDDHGLHGRMVGLRGSFEAMRQVPANEQDVLSHIAIIYQIFPNTILVWQGDHFEVWSSFPGDSPSAMSARASLLAPPNKTGSGYDTRWDKNWEILMDTVLNEDFVVARTIHANNLAGTRKDCVFGRQEAALQHFHRTLEHHIQQ